MWMTPPEIVERTGLSIGYAHTFGHHLPKRRLPGSHGGVEYDVSSVAHLIERGRWIRVRDLTDEQRDAIDDAGIEPFELPWLARPSPLGPWIGSRDLEHAMGDVSSVETEDLMRVPTTARRMAARDASGIFRGPKTDHDQF